MHLVYPPNQCFLSIAVVPREIKDNGFSKFGGINKAHYGLCENDECKTKTFQTNFAGSATHTFLVTHILCIL